MVFKKKLKPLKRTKRLLRKGNKLGHRINRNFADYLRADRREAVRFGSRRGRTIRF